jgi:iron complex outermembrane receptor protein
MKKLLGLILLASLSNYLLAQYAITGVVTDANGNPLIGAGIQVEGTLAGTVSTTSGNYELKLSKTGVINVSATYLGYEKQSQQIQLTANTTLNFTLNLKSTMTDEVLVKSTRASDNAPGTFTNLTKTEIEAQNLGQDLPYMLALSPSLVTNSDAGTGVGYTNFRIRGTDANRINVTVNGIPLNDAESHGVFWVNMPDFSSSIENIQVQRGVGTSTNGAAAFGATINMQTNTLQEKAYAEVSSSAGSFNTFKNTVKVGSGLLNKHFAFDARLSKITSDGFVDRAFSDLKSFYFSGGYYAENTLVKVNIFSGKESTYQSWWGVPKVRLENDLDGMQRYEDHWLYSHEETQHMINSDSRTYNYYTYDNETDNYQQDHYQLFFSQKLNEHLNFNAALHYTYGRGYYEQYRVGDDFADYGMEPIIRANNDTIFSTNLIRQKWLDNDFYGTVASLNYKTQKVDASLGGGANTYDGRHYGPIIWAQYMGDYPKDFEWYRNTGVKTDWNIYSKANIELTEKFSVYADLQFRRITHDIEGIDADLRDITQYHEFNFFNPKAGLKYKFSPQSEAYFYCAMGNREPNRSNFTDIAPGQNMPKSEQLIDFEAGYTQQNNRFSLGANAYYMMYNDQLVLTGQINDVGSAIMTNVDDSYRLGIELMGNVKFNEIASWDVNLTLSENRILNFTEYVDNWDTWIQDELYIGKTDIAFSPNVIFNSMLKVSPLSHLTIGLQSQFVGKQFIDNSQSKDRMLDPYFVNNLQVSYAVATSFAKELTVNFRVNNLLNTQYEANAWVYSYLLGGERYEMDGYFPQAGINFMAGVQIKF